MYVHPKNSKHLLSHSWAIMALDHSRLGLENKYLENKSGRIFLRSTGLLYKFLPTNLRVCKPTFYSFYTSHLRWNSTFYHTDLGQNTAFKCSGRSIVDFLTKPFKKFPKSPILQAQSSVWNRLSFLNNFLMFLHKFNWDISCKLDVNFRLPGI